MSTTNGGPAVTTTQNIVSQTVAAGNASLYDPSSVAITGGTSQGVVGVGPNVAQNGNTRLNYRKAIAKALSGRRARLLIYGDSTTVGCGAGTNTSGTIGTVGARAKNYPTKLAAALTAMGIPTWNESIVGGQNCLASLETYTAYDPRLVVSGFTETALATVGETGWRSVASGSTWAFTPGMTFDRFDVLTITNTGFGNLTANIDGGATLATIVNNVALGILKTTVTCARGTHTINLATTSTSPTVVLGVIPYDSTLGGLDIIQCGRIGGSMTTLAQNSVPYYPSASAMLTALSPDLAIVQMTIIDSASATSVSSYTTDLATVESALTTAGAETLLMSGIPSNNANAVNGTLDGIVGAVSARASLQSRAYADLRGRYTSYTSLNSLGWMFDTLHGTADLYADEAYWLARTLTSEVQ